MMFTSCPSCTRQFRVRARQLAAAEGLVQCGYCGKQFNALERLYDKPLLPENPLQAEQATPVLAGEPEFFIPGSEVPAGDELNPGGQTTANPTGVPSTGPDETETFSDTPLEEDSPYEGPATETAPDPKLETPAIRAENDVPDDPSRIAVDEQVSPEPETRPNAETLQEPDAGNEVAQVAEDYPFPEGPDAEEPRRSSWLLRLLWTTAVIVLVLAGVAQAAWFNRDMLLSHYPQLLPYARRICEQFDCTLIRNRNISAIKLLNRDVRVHPRYENALLVNATITNLSKYTQRFPVVLLTLFDSDGNVLGYRKIPPSGYLDSSIDIEAGMTGNSPVHFVFELAVDDQDAVSFEFDFL